MHILIVGEVGIGKSSLILRLLQHIDRPVYGFLTKKEVSDADGNCYVYIHSLNGNRQYTNENHIGTCTKNGAVGFPEAFNHFAYLLKNIPEGNVVLMDELGVMESEATEFCNAVLSVMDGDYHVIAAVKPKDTPFLQAVRMHAKARIYTIDITNRDALFERILRDQSEGSSSLCTEKKKICSTHS